MNSLLRWILRRHLSSVRHRARDLTMDLVELYGKIDKGLAEEVSSYRTDLEQRLIRTMEEWQFWDPVLAPKEFTARIYLNHSEILSLITAFEAKSETLGGLSNQDVQILEKLRDGLESLEASLITMEALPAGIRRARL